MDSNTLLAIIQAGTGVGIGLEAKSEIEIAPIVWKAAQSGRLALDAESAERLDGAAIDWEAGPEVGFVLRHPDAALVEFC